nr:hypothetical protein L203_02378 [Cryptococcus depauperatus CBS 7841]
MALNRHSQPAFQIEDEPLSKRLRSSKQSLATSSLGTHPTTHKVSAQPKARKNLSSNKSLKESELRNRAKASALRRSKGEPNIIPAKSHIVPSSSLTSFMDKREELINFTSKEHQKRIRKPLVARGARWTDIPDWGDRTDCPLFKLPAEVLDLCFGTKLNVGLQMRDYVALAGVSKYFRVHFTDTVFRNIYLEHNPEYLPALSRESQSPQRIPPTHLIFTRPVKDWYRRPPRKNFPQMEKYLCSRLPHSEWTKKDYDFWTEADSIMAEARSIWNEGKEEVAKKKRKLAEKQMAVRNVLVQGISRTILASVPGIEPGKTAGPKNELGIPLEHVSQNDTMENDVETDEKLDELDIMSPYYYRIKTLFNRLRSIHFDYSKWRKLPIEERLKALRECPDWTLPDETDIEQPYMVIYDRKTWNRVPHNHYPSPWRARAAEMANAKWIHRSDAIKLFRIGEAELLCLKHFLVPNPMNARAPQILYCLGAVQALALRSHGGPIAHHLYVERALQKASRSLNTRRQVAASLPLLLEPKSKQFRSRDSYEKVAAKYGLDINCGAWFWRGVFLDWIIDRNRWVERQKQMILEGLDADNEDQQEGSQLQEDNGGFAPGLPAGISFPTLDYSGDLGNIESNNDDNDDDEIFGSSALNRDDMGGTVAEG